MDDIQQLATPVSMPILCRDCFAQTVEDVGARCDVCTVISANRAAIANDFTRRRIAIIGILLAATTLVWFFVAVTRG